VDDAVDVLARPAASLAGPPASPGAPQQGAHRTASDLPFFAALHAHGDRVAVIGPDGSPLSYAGLAARVDEAAARLGTDRRLVLLQVGNDVDSLVAYLAALRGGHPAMLVARDDPRHVETLVGAYDPDVVVAGAQVRERRPGTCHELHPELALLLCTSGSTGSPKLVRLSAANLTANAAAIATYLDIRETDRAVAALPLHYCYGLSVVNSNLLRGAGLVLTDRSVTDPDFWADVRAHGATSLHGVPYTFDLLDRIGFAELDLPQLRYVTQAGGRLPADQVRRYAELGAARGWSFFVMYGQTEATARMAYLPPELAAARPSSIGVPIPGGSFELVGGDGEDPDQGELVYRGPNVMLGYAQDPADLAAGRTVEALRTGDLARRGPDGLYEVIGRRSRFVKLFGLRIDMQQVERALEDEGCAAVCSGGDDLLLVAVTAVQDVRPVHRLVTERFGLPAAGVRVHVVEEFPRLDSGKIDYVELERLGRSAEPPAPQPGPVGIRGRRVRSVHDAFRRVFPLRPLPDDASFAGLGGDSLSYVQMSVELEDVLGHLPASWPDMTIAELERCRRRRRVFSTMETGVVLRAVAIVLVVGSHVGLFHVLGGAHVLLVVAGWAFARFVLVPEGGTDPSSPGRRILPSRRIVRSLIRIAVPSMAWIGLRAVTEQDIEIHNALLINYLIDPSTWGYWYVETLVQTLALVAVLFAVPAVRRAERAHPFAFAVGALLLSALGRALPDDGNEFTDRFMSTHLVLWLFVLGWLVHRATTPGRRLVVLGLVAVLVPGFFGDPARDAVVAAGVATLLLVRGVPVPRVAVRPVASVAGASLSVYLTHYAVYPLLLGHLEPLVVVACCLAVGVGTWWTVTAVAQHAAAVARQLRPAVRRRRAGNHEVSPAVS
jgi:acyl-CoA synthetase (AMP-forming)/AMP-acid ligase II